MGESGDPRKQPRPDGQAPGQARDDVTAAFPPSLSGVVTTAGAEVVPFAFPGGKAVNLVVNLGLLTLNLHFPPQSADIICDAIQAAKREATTGVIPASWAEAEALATKQKALNGNGH